MAVVNQYLFYGVTLTTTDETTMFDPANTLPLISETYIIKSFRVTNNTGNTPTITIKNNTFNIVNAQTLVANASTEILTLPLVVEGSKLLKVTMSSGDSVTIGITYLNIKKEVTV
jgi:outer membrane lipoprotein-sorting protein